MKSVAAAFALSLFVLFLSAPADPEDLSSPAPASSPGPGRARIEVISQLGKPIPEARVVLYQFPDPKEDTIGASRSWVEVVPESVSPGVFEKEIAPGTYRIEATGEEWLGAVEEEVEIKSGEIREIKFSLEPGSVISGRVSDKEGNPLSNVEVSYSLSGSRQSAWFRSRDRRAVTDSSGWFAFRDLAPGVYNLKFSRPGYIAAEADDASTGTTDLVVVMQEGFTIRGRLEGDLEGLESPIRLELEGAGRGMGLQNALSRNVELGSGNTFEIGDLKREIYSVRLRAKDYLSGWVREVPALPPEKATPITLAVSRGASLSGRVTEAGTGSPLSGVKLQLYPAGSKTGDYESSNRRGEFSFRGLEGGEYVLKAWLWQDRYSKFRLQKKVAIEPGQEVANFDLELEAGREITFSGVVLDEKGDPVGEADIQINFRPAGEKSYRRNFRNRDVSKSSGDFILSAYIESGGEAVITADKKGYAPAEKRVELSPDQTSSGGIILTLDSGVTLEVEVEGGDGGGEAVPSAIVALNTHRSKEEESRNYVKLKKLTDVHGRCRFENLSPGAYRVEVSKSGYSTVKEEVRLDGSEPVKTVSLALNEGRMLMVRVEDESGAAVEGAAISAGEKTGGLKYILDRPDGENRTDSSGVCLLRDLPAAPLILTVQADGYVSAQRYRVGEDQDEVGVILKAAGSIRGRFLGDGGHPLDDLNILTARQSSGPFDFESAFTKTRKLGNGVFQVDNLSPGVYDLTIRSPDRAGRKLKSVEVEAGRETDLGEIVFGPESEIRGRVRTQEDDSPLRRAWVRIEEPKERLVPFAMSSDMTDSEGNFTISGLNPGTLVLTVTAKNYRPVKISGIIVGSGEEKIIPDIHLARLTEIEREEQVRRSSVVPSLGVRIKENEGEAGRRSLQSLFIEEVLPGTAAANSGLAAGDEIVKINGNSFAEDTLEFLQGLLAPPGTEIKVTVKRAGTGREEEVDLIVDQWSMEDVIPQAD